MNANHTPEFIVPDWPVPANIKAACTTRVGGYSQTPWGSFNLGTHVGDNTDHVVQNRQLLVDSLQLPAMPVFLDQVHETTVVCADQVQNESNTPVADACWSGECENVVAIMTADCLPVLFASQCGSVVAAAHAGWRGLANGVLEATIASLPVEPQQLLAWLGPAIGPEHFEVGPEVRQCFIDKSPAFAKHFEQVEDKYLANLFALGRDCLTNAGVGSVHGGGLCTYSDAARFYSYRRDAGQTGRLAALIWKT